MSKELVRINLSEVLAVTKKMKITGADLDIKMGIF